ncbi:N-acetyltransferase family protein [Pseudomonas xanthosomatis]|uniref:N-acetyltransferase family protein n=1 Tax=Pseudomonas xanthosomatis TaxID=2842356 RepID=UPI00351225A0
MLITRIQALDDDICDQLADVLIDCIEGGASVSFMWPLPRERAIAFWRSLSAEVASGHRALLVARNSGGQIVGTVQVALAQPDNQQHRVDVAKLLVHRNARRKGVARALMERAETVAADEGKSVLVLDTATGGEAEILYLNLGWTAAGVIPGYALWPKGGLCSTTILYKLIDSSGEID